MARCDTFNLPQKPFQMLESVFMKAPVVFGCASAYILFSQTLLGYLSITANIPLVAFPLTVNSIAGQVILARLCFMRSAEL
jgi:hypothetical protein